MTSGEMRLAPWLEARWPGVATAIESERLAHAVLVEAGPGVGAGVFARRLLAALLCTERSPDGHACDHCPACRFRISGSHPDMTSLVPEETGGLIKIGQIRGFAERLYLTAQYATGRVALVDPADRLTPGAANALLKILEEPPLGCHILLVSERISAIAATIRSRCQRWRLTPPSPAEGAQWLQAAGADTTGFDEDRLRAPYRCRSDHNDNDKDNDNDDSDGATRAQWDADLVRLLRGRAGAVAVAERARSGDGAEWIDWAYRRVSGLLCARLGAPPAGMSEPLIAVADVLSPIGWQEIAGRINEAARLLYTNSDWQLVIESVLLAMVQHKEKRTSESWPSPK